jgi:hypothetical protein
MKTKPILDIENPPVGSIPATVEQLLALGFSPDEIEAGEKRAEAETFGPWGIVSRLCGIVISVKFDRSAFPTRSKRFRAWPARSMSRPRPMGYDMEGKISLGGAKVRAFTSSQLFELPDGKLINAFVLFACLD